MTDSTTSQDFFNITPRHVAAARGLLHMTQAELATAAGVHENTIRRFEAHTQIPRPSRLKAIREALERRGIVFLNHGSPGVRLRDGAVLPV